ncbi:hypothetical protein PDESU_04844 [Pontiella desulfatans]|uniref:LamG-like jellyroll fold domain-containing protein n=1 Tax=Pontiella desulfatans TaxID=2750659 RepID=A0A6C2U8T8_PONDE|nr:LamG domain-containing protein [Pontiella desulfatans]VGO16253.1 hypothetical protein PDESU_04844 [Pontiella desulfatans]
MKLYFLRVTFFLIWILIAADSSAQGDLILNWTFDSVYPNGYIEPDASGNSHDGRLVWYLTRRGGGGEYRPGEGIIGGAAAVVDRGSIFSDEPLTLPSEWSVSIWLKPKDADEIIRSEDMIAFWTDDGTTKALTVTFTQGKFKIGSVVNGSSKSAEFYPSAAWAVDEWVHLVVTFGNDAINMYLNGTALVRRSGIVANPWDPSIAVTPMLTGSRGQAHHRFDGPIDEFRIYGGILSVEEVAALADPSSDFYADEVVPPVADPGMGYTVWLDGATAEFELDGDLLLPGTNGTAAVSYLWEVAEKPAGAALMFADATDPKSAATADTAGDYVLRLITGNGAAVDTGLVHTVVFDAGSSGGSSFFTADPNVPLLVNNYEPERDARKASGALPLVAHYAFDEGGGTTATATGSAGGSFNIGSSAWSSDGMFGGALHVAPGAVTPQLFDLGTFTELTDEFSLSFWIRSDRTDKRGDLFRANGTGTTDYWKLGNQHNKGGLPDGYGQLNWNSVSCPVKAGEQWNHIVITYSASSGFRKLYLNGNLEGSMKFDPLAAGSGSPRLLFSTTSGSYCFRGLLDDVAVYGTTLNNEEISLLYSQSADTVVNRAAEDPYKTGAYSPSFVQQYFPELTPQYVTNGFAEARFGSGAAPAAYEHPRIVFSRDDLAAARAQYRGRDGHRTLAELFQYTEVERLSNMDTSGNYQPAFSLDGGSDERGIPNFTSDNGAAATIVAEAYLALLEADSVKARNVIDWLIATAALQRPVIDASRLATSHWRHDYHDILQRRATPLIYDWLYAWMTPAERATIRGIIADAAAGHWSIGMNGQPASDAHRSNWQNWITGEYLLALSAIYEEDGFDPEGYATAARAVELSGILFGDSESGASAEGMGKASLVTGSMAMLSRTQQTGRKLIGSAMPLNHVRKFTFHHLAPWGSEIFKDAENGGLFPLGASAPIRVLHYAYPDDPILNYLKHASFGGVDNYGDLQLTTFSQDSYLMSAMYNQDWSGPADLGAHLQEAAAAAGEPLGWFSNYRGLMTGRSDWTTDALQLIYQPKCLTTGHLLPSRGYFVINALGRNWVPFDGHNAEASKLHSVVRVDDVGQDISAARVLFYEGAAGRAGAGADLMGGDLTAAYRQIGDAWETLNATRLFPDTQRPWMDMDKRYLVHWELADRPGTTLAIPLDEYGAAQTFDYAYRTATLVRGDYPYALIIDDLKKDGTVREYNWSMTMPKDIYTAGSYTINGDSVVYTDPDDSTKHLLIKVIDSAATVTFDVSHETFTAVDGPAEAWKLNGRADAAEGRFRVMLYPYRDGDPQPVVSGTGSNFTVTLGSTVDAFELTTTEGKPNAIEISRNGDLLASSGSGASSYVEWSSLIDWAGGGSGELDDPDGDGISNFMEYALDGDPLVYDRSILPEGRLIGDGTDPWFAMDYRQNSRADDLDFMPMDSTNLLAPWSGVIPDGNDAVLETVDPDPDGDASARSMRVRVKALSDSLFLRLGVSSADSGK